MLKPLKLWITTNCGKFLETKIPGELTCFLRNLYGGQEATDRYGTTDWFKTGKGVHQGCMLSPHFLLQGNLPDPRIKPGSPALWAESLPTEL